jgi:tetratricopeptide (TPR) repeat protein
MHKSFISRILTNKSIVVPIFSVGLSIFSLSPVQGQVSEIKDSTWGKTQQCDSLMKEFKVYRRNQEFEKAEKIAKAALEQCPENSIYWGNLALNYLESADNSYSGSKKTAKKNKLNLFNLGLEAARISAEKDSMNKDAYEYMSMAHAGILSLSSYTTQAKLADSVRIYAEKSVEVDPKNDRAFHILGRWHYEVAQLNWLIKFFSELFAGTAPEGSYENALFYFEKAASINDFPVHYYWIAKTHIKMGETKKAIQNLEKAIQSKGGQHNDAYFRRLSKEEISKL